MANGMEDLWEKNRGRTPAAQRYREWSTVQGREDAEMLQEKSGLWNAANLKSGSAAWNRAAHGDYDAWGDE